MEIKPKTILDAEKTVLNRKGEGSALKEKERIMSTPEFLFLHDLKKRGLEVIHKNDLDVWFVQSAHSEGGLELKDIQDLFSFQHEHNKKVREDDENGDAREYCFKNYDSGDLRYYLEQTYEKPELIREIPEIIVIHGKPGEFDGDWTGIPHMIQKSVDKCLDRLNYYWDDAIIQHLGENLCSDLTNKFDFEKLEATEENLIEYGLTNLEMSQRGRQKDLFEKYIFSGEEQFIVDFFSDDVLHEIYNYMCEVPEESINGFLWEYEDTDDVETDFYQQFKVPVDHVQKKKEWEDMYAEEKRTGQIEENDESEYEPNYEEMRAAIENYWIYRESLAEAARALSFEEIKEKMRQCYVSRVKPMLDEYAPEYIREFERFEAEKRLLKPVLIHVSENPVQRELMRDEGADVVLEKFPISEMRELFELAGRMKASSASLVSGELRRIKSEFYKSVEDKLDNRSEITAETEKEIEILDEIFKSAGNVENVLDVACGNGRIDIPLLERGYVVTGIDANENFLQDALRKTFEKGLSQAKFKRGDVIDYRKVIEPGSQDAVIYTWHSILEAFGPGNLLHTLGSAHLSLRPGGVLVFDQPTRENPHMEDGWYGNDPDSEHHYLSYIMEEEEIKFILKMAGFENIEIRKWTTKGSEEYPDGMNKFTVSARKPDADARSKGLTKMYRSEHFKTTVRLRHKEDTEWADEFERKKRKNA
jgi:SAM-dependent methyltransferase